MQTYALWMTIAVAFLIAAPRTEADTNRWEGAIEAFEKRDAVNPPEPGAILFVGSSSIRFWKTDEAFGNLDVINRGFGGSQTSDVVHYMDRIVLPYAPRQIVLYAGDNDIAAGKSPRQVFADTKGFCERVHDTLPDTEILYIAIKPSILRWNLVDKMREANALIREYAQADDRIVFVDVDPVMLDEHGQPREELFMKDGLHLSEEGYALWNGIVGPLLHKGGPE